MPAPVCQVRALSKQAGELSACICVQQPNRPKEQGGEKNKTKEINEEPRFLNETSLIYIQFDSVHNSFLEMHFFTWGNNYYSKF